MSSQPPSSSSALSPGGRLSGKVALITGGANPAGFGAAIARRFVSEGARVLIGDLDGNGASSVASSCSSSTSPITSNCQGLKLDVTAETDWITAVEFCFKTWGRLDIVVNNAGTTYRNKATAEVTEAEWARVFDVNVKSVFWCAKTAIPALQKQGTGGAVVNISSIGSLRPRPGLVWYNASKAAVTNATKGLAAEYGPDQIRVNAIAPLLSATGLFESFVGVKDTPENRTKFAEAIPLKRLTDPDDVANTALYLASDEGSFITGVNLEVDGGRGI